MLPAIAVGVASDEAVAAEPNPQHETATQDDIQRIIQSIRLRDERIVQAESELRRVTEEYRKLREELLPIFKMAKDRSQPLPYDPPNSTQPAGSPDLYNHSVSSPPISQTSDKTSGGLARTFSKKLFLGSTPKNNSPTHIPSAIQQGKTMLDSSVDPSAAAMVASNHLTASMSGGSLPNASPNAIPAPSPTSPAPYHGQTLASRSYARDGTLSSRSTTLNDHVEDHPTTSRTNTTQYARERDPPTSANSFSSKANQASNTMSTTSTLVSTPHTSTTSTLLPSSHGSTATTNSQVSTPAPQAETPSVEIFKSFRVGLEDPCYKVLPAALRKYNINADWRQYALFIVFGDQERCVGLDEKPLSLFKMYDREGKRPMFMLRRLAVPQEGGDPTQMATGHQNTTSNPPNSRGGQGAVNVPGGVL